MSLAVDTVLNSGLSIQHAAQDYDLPRSTLSDDVSTCILPGTLSGPGRHFSLEHVSLGYPQSCQHENDSTSITTQLQIASICAVS